MLAATAQRDLPAAVEDHLVAGVHDLGGGRHRDRDRAGAAVEGDDAALGDRLHDRRGRAARGRAVADDVGGSLVSTARPAAGTVACPSGLPADSVVPPVAVAPVLAVGLLPPVAWRVPSTAVPAVTKAGWPSRLPPAGAVPADAALPGGTVAGVAATAAQAAAPVTRKPAAASLAQTRPNRPTSRITRHGSGTAPAGRGHRAYPWSGGSACRG